MSKKPEEKLAPKEWPARHDAACAIVARKYCNMFGFCARADTSHAAAWADAAAIRAPV